jgi:hypothetical protein
MGEVYITLNLNQRLNEEAFLQVGPFDSPK